MVPLLFIIMVVAALSMLIYWVLANIDTTGNVIPPNNRFRYELAPELSIYGESDLYVMENTVKLSGNDAKNMLAYWNLSQTKFTEEVLRAQIKPDPDKIVLRLYEVNEGRTHFDIKARSLAGRCRLELQPGNQYYLQLGFHNREKFIPLLTSDTVTLSRPAF
ncbi:MAG TPA: DUF4912 domain-containing protein [Syntrophomonadaceae bacterium]|nr:DUF4912 domain-containing protein [Syntrophomonadaceae bacterium]